MGATAAPIKAEWKGPGLNLQLYHMLLCTQGQHRNLSELLLPGEGQEGIRELDWGNQLAGSFRGSPWPQGQPHRLRFAHQPTPGGPSLACGPSQGQGPSEMVLSLGRGERALQVS